ncbi:MAG TPA: type II CAAX endopeptidase family protein [Thermoanaerobaculia bacterium]|nr:type II CAAX endopeptidase family protein [Thermoanaerobaculia bacterium]
MDRQSLPSRIWNRVPIVVRAVLSGFLVLTVGGILTGPLLFANIKFSPDVPWSVPLLAAYMWFFWQYLRGRWWPRSTADARRRGLRANPLSSRTWLWAMTTGSLSLVGIFALHVVVGRLTPLNITIPPLLRDLPSFTLISVLLMVSVIAGIVEEAAFRGFMQGPIEKRHGVVAAIAVVSVVFGIAHLTDWQPSMTAARMGFIVLAAIFYGIMVHVTNSILPGLILHAAGNAIGTVWIWLLSRGPQSKEVFQRGFAAASADPQFWVNCAVVLVFGIAAVWAFRRLAVVANDKA